MWDDTGPIELPDIALVRMGGSAPANSFSMLQCLDEAGVRLINSLACTVVCRDKSLSYAKLAKAGVSIPRTFFMCDVPLTEEMITELGPPPWVAKPSVSAKGIDVVEVKSMHEAQQLLQKSKSLGQQWLIQELIEESRGTDVRVFVLNGKALAAMRRTAKKGELRSNIYQGGTTQCVELTSELVDIAENAAAAVQAQVAGVDILMGKNGPVVCEINGSPGLEGLNSVANIDLAKELVSYLVAHRL